MKPFQTAGLFLFGIAFAAPFIFSGCGSGTEVEQTWTAPEVKELSYQRILVVATTPDGAARRIVEDEVRKYVTSTTVIPGYTVLPDSTALKDPAKLKKVLADVNADGLVVVRPVSDITESYDAPGTYPVPYHTIDGYWSSGYGLRPLYGDPVVYTDRVVQVETSIYDVKSGKLVWSGTTETRNPSNLKGLISDICTTLRTELRKQKLIP
ncbi:MAG: hypothetical protein LBV12_11230 [Puniceicoccales bacterium]|jgi:hypothetical protein|nr:hypothetical protein [Puniceicoccales bacterium]